MNEVPLFEKLGVEYEERDGILYPLLDSPTGDFLEDVNISIGKYGLFWIGYLEVAYPQRYKSLARFAKLKSKAIEVNEMAYELLDDIEMKFFRKRKAENLNSFTEMYQLRMEARMLAEEIVLHDIVHKYH